MANLSPPASSPTAAPVPRPGRPSQPQPTDDGLDGPLVAAVLAVLGAGLGATSTRLLLGRRLEQAGIDPVAAALAVRLGGRPARPPGRHQDQGVAGRTQRALEMRLRAAYIVNAARRLQVGFKAGRLREALGRERRFLAQHVDAARRRAAAVERVDAAAAALEHHQQVTAGGPAPSTVTAPSGRPYLGWHLGMTGEHTAACLAAAGHNFDPAIRPRIGYPGTVHPRCRCWPGPAFPGATTVDEATRRLPAGAD